MVRATVISSMFKSLGYDPATLTIEVEFAPRKDQENGNIYQYTEVQPWVWDEFSRAKSLGSYFLKNIKPNYKATKIEPPKLEPVPDATN